MHGARTSLLLIKLSCVLREQIRTLKTATKNVSRKPGDEQNEGGEFNDAISVVINVFSLTGPHVKWTNANALSWRVQQSSPTTPPPRRRHGADLYGRLGAYERRSRPLRDLLLRQIHRVHFQRYLLGKRQTAFFFSIHHFSSSAAQFCFLASGHF